MQITPTMDVPFLNVLDYKNLENWSSHFLLSKKLSYNNHFPLVKLGALLKRNKYSIKIQDDALYKRATIQMNAKGVKLRDEVKGKFIGTKNQFIIKSGQFLLSKIDARNGAFGVVPNDLDDAIITGNFWTFDVNYKIINPFYLSILTGTKQFQDLCQTASVGTTNRNYLQEDLFLNFEIPLPAINEQALLVSEYERYQIESEKCLIESFIIKRQKEDFFNDLLGITKKKISQHKPFSTIEFRELNKWGVTFTLKKSEWNISPKFTEKKISSICKIGSGGTPSKSVKSFFGGHIPWVKTTEVKNNLITTTEEHLTEEGLKNSSAKIYPRGSLIVAMYGQGLTRGRTAKLGIDACTNQACAVLYDIDNSVILTDYLWYFFINEYDRLRELASGNNQPNLNAGMISNYLIQIPALEVQQQVVNNISLYNRKIEALLLDADRYLAEALSKFEKSIFD